MRLDQGRRPSPRGLMLRRFLRSPSGLIGGLLVLVVGTTALLADIIAPGDPLASAGPSLRSPSGGHLMGTDNFGRDLLRAVVHGTRTSMTVVVWVVVMSLVIGLAVGMLSGYRGGVLDAVLMRVTEMFQSIPRFFLAILVVGLFGSGLDNLILLLGLTSWDLLARVVRAESLSLRRREFVDAARSMGASDGRILVRHILPNILPSAVVVASLLGSRVILIEAALSFIGLGDPNSISLGSLLDNAQQFLAVAWWMSVFPGLAIAVAVLGLNLLGDAVNDLLHPTGMSRPRPRRAQRTVGAAAK
ncbi:MAG: ABC transporter permease [Actinomycetota bacterium]|nr:ABC transporter permease [Actinomycetota bacterium]